MDVPRQVTPGLERVADRLLDIEAWERRRNDLLTETVRLKSLHEDRLLAALAHSHERQRLLDQRVNELESTLTDLLQARSFRLGAALSRFGRVGRAGTGSDETIRSLLERRVPPGEPVPEPPDRLDPEDERAICEAFHRLYYESEDRTWKQTDWFGVHIQKLPLDMWVYQEILHEVRPDVVVECGTFQGGSAYFMATLFDLMDHGRVVTVDIEERPGRPEHDRITYLAGSSTDPAVVDTVRSLVHPGEIVLVILDSDHSEKHVREELACYHDLVSVGSYLIVEDTNVFGHPVLLEHGPGPMEALEDFLSTTEDFVSDTAREKFLVTFHPKGFLLRVK